MGKLGGILVLLSILPGLALAEEFFVEEVETFTSPDSSHFVIKEFIDSTNSSIYINAYTFTSEEVAGYLLQEMDEGVEVFMVVEESPVGGMEEEEERLLKALNAGGAKVHLFSSEKLRFNHAKYIVVDNTSLMVVSENFGENGFPTSAIGNRGWGAVVYDWELAAFFAELFFADLERSEPFRKSGGFFSWEESGVKTGELTPARYRGFFILETAIAPKNAMEETLELIGSVNESLYVEQFYVYTYFGRGDEGGIEETPNKFLEASIDAARRGAEVKVLLDSTWYNVDKSDPRSNYYSVRYLNRIASEENLDLEARLGCFRDGIEKYHVKGLVVDGKVVMIGTMNWNLHSPTKNREVI